MLPVRHRLRSSADFRAAIRRGRRAGGTVLVLHLLEPAGAEPVRIGLVVSRAVGPAVVRNLVKRRLRHLLRERLGSHPGSLPSSGLLVVRALPGAGAASYVTLGTELDRLLDRVRAGAAR